MLSRKTSLSQNIVQFARYLRQHQFASGVEEEATALQALQYINYQNKQVFQTALRAVFCRSKTQSETFDELFNEYWKQTEKGVESKLKEHKTSSPQKPKPTSFQSLKAWLHGNRSNETIETATYSVQENLGKKDFASVPEDETEALMQLIKKLAKRLAAKTNRRYEASPRNDMPDLRRTIRKNLRRGGELLEIVHRRPKRNRVKLVLICDVSRSMELYSVFLIQFMYAFQQVYRRMETFIFSTSLYRITTALKQPHFNSAMQLLGKYQTGWSGGTRIGEALDSFTKQHAKQMVDKNTIVIILSDGWDTGDIDLLEKNMQEIDRKSKKIIWLNPLAGYGEYRPDTAGMRAALPYTDVFASVHNLESLEKLSRWL